MLAGLPKRASVVVAAGRAAHCLAIDSSRLTVEAVLTPAMMNPDAWDSVFSFRTFTSGGVLPGLGVSALTSGSSALLSPCGGMVEPTGFIMSSEKSLITGRS